jgi:transposase-like protein
MSKKKRTFSAVFKSKVVLVLLSREKTLAQVATKYQVTPTNMKSLKKKHLEKASISF